MSQLVRNIIANNVKCLRTSKGLRREELSLLLGYDNSYISKLEKSRVNITVDKIEQIAKYFDIEPYFLLKKK
jgi:transcriptional regulator with XRE-family HTH domain